MRRYWVLFLVFLTFCRLSLAQEKLTANEVVTRSLAAIGSSEARGQVSYLELTGKSRMATNINTISAEGTALLVSEKNQVKFKTKFDSKRYGGDQVVYNGREVQISRDGRGVRSAMGEFLFHQSRIVSEGLLGGVLSTAWPLSDPKIHGATLKYEGMKKVGGARLHQLTYMPKKSMDNVTINIYFDENFRHVKTTYELMVPQESPTLARTMSTTTEANSYLLEENFSGFLNIGGLWLPTRHSFSYTSTNAELGRWTFDMVYDEINGTKLPAAE